MLLVALFWGAAMSYGQSRTAQTRRTAATSNGSPAFPDFPLTRQLQADGVFVKETTDRRWQIRIAGTIPRQPGCLAVVYNEAGDVILRAPVASGTYADDRPFTINVPADGAAQQYVIKFVGQQDNLTGMIQPLTDLSFEVYGGRRFTFGPGTVPKQRALAAFQVTPDVMPLHLGGWKGDYRLYDARGEIVIDSKDSRLPAGDPRKKWDEREVETLVPNLEPGNIYWFDSYGMGYLDIAIGNLYFTFDPERWFAPSLSWTLADRPWWKGARDAK